jgi:uncharacterized membrane protein YtjA (UPF0391 family)
MLKWAIIFALISIIAGLFGFTGIEGAAAAIARVLFFLLVGAVVILLILSLFVRHTMD